MKKIGKLLTVVVVLLSLVGCGCMKKTAKGAVQDYLNQYKNLSSNVINDMDKQLKVLYDYQKQQEKIYQMQQELDSKIKEQ